MGQNDSKNALVDVVAVNRGLYSFPQNFMKEKHPQLTRINISHNKFKSLPLSFNFAENLQELNISYNYLDTLPKEFSNNINIMRIDVTNNKFSDFPHIPLKSLTTLLMGSNLIKNFNHDISILYPQLNNFSLPRNLFFFFLYFFLYTLDLK
jgi:Leucine-rich repeat (LRR) protein